MWLAGLGVLWSLYLVVVAVWIVLQRRSPVSTIGWLLAMAVLPVLGLAVYYIFGPRRFRRQKVKRVRSRRKARLRRNWIKLQDQVPNPPERLGQLVQLATASSMLPLCSAHEAQLLVGGAATFDALLAAIAQAEHHIHLEYYIFEPDHTGQSLLAALTARAAAGVEVRLLVDALGSKRLGRKHYQPLLNAGGQVALFHPPKLGRRIRPVINFRTHRKIMVVDGVWGFTGGVNITDSEDKRRNPLAYHDIHLRLRGGIVGWLQQVFWEDWAYALNYQRHQLPHSYQAYFPRQPSGALLGQVLASGPDSSLEAIHRVLLDACHAAHQRLWLTTPYFVPTEALVLALTSAALRGVDVRVLVPERSDSRLVTAAARSYFDELLMHGVRVLEYQGRMLHAKTLLVDDWLGMVGTANFDNRSFRLNYEVCALIYGSQLAHDLALQFEQDSQQARSVPYGRLQPFAQRLLDASARLFSPLL